MKAVLVLVEGSIIMYKGIGSVSSIIIKRQDLSLFLTLLSPSLFLSFFLSFFHPLTTVFSHSDFSHEKFGSFSPDKASYDRIALPYQRCMLGVLVFP